MIENDKDKIEICLKVIEKYFTLLKILGVGFMAILGINDVVSEMFGKTVAYISVVVVAVLISVIVLTLSKKFAIISKLNIKDQ